MKKESLSILLALLGSGAITYFFVTETNGSKLKQENPTIYNNLQEKPEELKTKITETETELATLKTEYETKIQAFETMAEGEGKNTAETELKQKEAELIKKQETVSLYKGVESYGLKMPILSLSNIGKSLGIFVLLLATIWFVISKLLMLIFNRKDN